VAVSGKTKSELKIKEIKMKNTYEEKIKAQIANAIERSKANAAIVHVEIDGDSGDALSAIRELTDCQTEYAMLDREGIDLLDIWGFKEGTKDGDVLWRLNIRFTGQ